MNDGNPETIEQIEQFLQGSEAIEFRAPAMGEKYDCIDEVMIRFRYHRLKRNEKGVIRRYIERVTGYSRSQASRLIAEYKRKGLLKHQPM
jgi:Fic family protein